MFRIALIAILIIIVDNRHGHKIENWLKEKIWPSKIRTVGLILGLLLAAYLLAYHWRAVLIGAAVLVTLTLLFAFRAEIRSAVKGIGKRRNVSDAA